MHLAILFGNEKWQGTYVNISLKFEIKNQSLEKGNISV
jgi:hypothetical protein